MKQTFREIPKYEGLPLTHDTSHTLQKRMARMRGKKAMKPLLRLRRARRGR
jgi:hypothetical protein